MEKLEAALALPGQPVKRGTMAHKHIIYMMLVEAAAQLPDPTALSEYAERLEELATQDSHKPYLAVAHRGWGIAHRLDGDYDLAKERLQQALALFVATISRRPWERSRRLKPALIMPAPRQRWRR